MQAVTLWAESVGGSWRGRGILASKCPGCGAPPAQHSPILFKVSECLRSALHVLVILSGVPFDSLKKTQKVSYSIYTKRQQENEDGFWISLQELLGLQMPNSDRMNPLL